jgi:hypothetical protein
MKKFFLIVFGDFNSEEFCKEVALTLTPIVDSPHLKFNHTKGNIFFHFASEVSQEEIYEYVMISLIDKCQYFILAENTDKVSLFLPPNVQEHLMDLVNEGNDVEMRIQVDSTKNLMSQEDEEEFVALLLEEVKRQVKKPSLDQILDKLNNKGIDALTKFEKDTLDEYSINL